MRQRYFPLNIMTPSRCVSRFPYLPSRYASLPHRRYPIVATPASLPHRRYPIAATPSPLPHRRYPIAATPSPLPHRRYPIAATPSPLPHRRYPIAATPSPLPHHRYPITATPSPLPPPCYTICSYPFPTHPAPPPAPPHKVSPHVQVWGRAANVEKQALRFDPSGSEAGTLPDLSGKVTLNTTRGQLTLLSQDCVHAGSAFSLSTGKTVTVHCLIGFQKKPDVYSKTTGRKETFTFPYDVPYPVWSEALKQSVQTSSQNRSGWHYEAASRLKACIVATEQGGLLVKLGFHLDL